MTRGTTPPCLPSIPLPPSLYLPLFLPILPLHSPSTSSLPLPDAKTFTQAAWCLPAALAWSQLQQKERQRQRAYQRKPKALETQQKTTETETCSPQATVCACKVPGRVPSLLPGKILMPTNQIRAISPVHTYSANYVCVHFRHLGVYKESRVAYRAIRVRVS